MKIRKFFQSLNVVTQCKKYNLGLWECPAFLTVIMGLVTILAMLGTYYIANYYYQDPEITALIVILTTVIIFVISYFIINSFNYLAEANRMKSEFVSITSHQLRTPLSSTKWSLNLLMEDELQKTGAVDEKTKEYLDIIQSSNERMIKLVNDLLDVSRVEQGRFDLKPQKFSLVDLFYDLIKETAPLANSHEINVELTIKDHLPEVWADASRIRLVAQNLLDNAIKYSNEKSQVRIILSADKRFVRWEIKDSGVGIPKNQQSQIFQKFFRSENAKKHQTDGTGLGLFIAKAIIEVSGGKIGFESTENKGSIFWFTLPIKS